MKKIIFLLALIPNLAFAQGWQIPNPAGTPRALPTPGTVMTKANVDTFGNQQVVAVDGSGSGETQSVIPVSNAVNLNGVGAINAGFAFVVSDTMEAASTTTVINATSHLARVGDSVSVRGGTAANIGVWTTISAVTANTITLANALPATPAAADSFYILRPAPFSVNNNLGGGGATTNSLNVAIDSSGQGAAATGILKLEDSAAGNTDALVGVAGIINVVPAAPAADGDYAAIALGATGAVQTLIDSRSQTSFASGILKTEDAAAASGDALVGVAGERNDSLGNTKTGNNGDYGTIAIGNRGEVLSAGAMNEDVAPFDQMYLATIGLVREDALTVNTGTSGDVTWAKADAAGRTITTLAPAGESWQGCGTSTASTADVAIKAAVASNRVYVTNIGCSNTSATTATQIVFKDGATGIFIGAVTSLTATSQGAFGTTFPVPLRLTSNTAFNFAAGTAVSSLTCCASGYISVN